MKVAAKYSNLVPNYVEYFQSSSDMKKVDLQIKKEAGKTYENKKFKKKKRLH